MEETTLPAGDILPGFDGEQVFDAEADGDTHRRRQAQALLV